MVEKGCIYKDSHQVESLGQLGLGQGSPFSAAPDVSASPSPLVEQPWSQPPADLLSGVFCENKEKN